MPDKKKYYSLRDIKTNALKFTGRNSTDLKALRSELLHYAKGLDAKITPEKEAKLMKMKAGRLAKFCGWKLIKHREPKES